MYVFAELIGSYLSVSVGVSFAFQAFDDVVSEDAVSAAPFGAFEGKFAIAAGGQREERLIEVQEGLIYLRAIGFRSDGSAVAGVGEEHFPFGVDLAADDGTERLHGIGGAGDVIAVDVVRCEKRFAIGDEAVAGEVDQDSVVILGNRGQPVLELELEV